MKFFVKKINNEKNYLLKKVSQYLKYNNDALSSLNYLYTNGGSAGYYKLKSLEQNSNCLKYLNEYLKEVGANFFKSHDLKIINNRYFKNSYENIYLTWGNKTNFSKNGIFKDKYFRKSSINVKNLWIVIYEDYRIPTKITDNTIIVIPKRNNFSISCFIKNILSIFKNSDSLNSNFFRYLPFSSVFANAITNNLLPLINNINFKKIYIPYESQPFQQYFIRNIKLNFKKNIKVIGYIHSFLPAFPSYYIFRKFSPDQILVHGSFQKKILSKYLGWKNKKIKVIRSLRFKKKDNLDKNYFFISYNLFKNSNKNLTNFELFLKDGENFKYKKCDIKLHPAKKNDPKHKNFELEIKRIVSKFSKKFSKNRFSKKINFCFGESSVIIESLERGVEVVHFSQDPVLEVFVGDLWKNIVVKEISKNVYHYKLKKKGLYLKF